MSVDTLAPNLTESAKDLKERYESETKVAPGIGVVSCAGFMETFGPNADRPITDDAEIVAPFKSRDPLNLHLALRDIEYSTDWMRWLSSDSNDKILSAKDCIEVIGCLQFYSEFVLSAKLLPQEVRFEAMDGDTMRGTANNRAFYSRDSEVTLTVPPKPEKGFNDPMHVQKGRYVGMPDGSDASSINEFLDSGVAYEHYRDAALQINEKLKEIRQLIPGFYRYVDSLRERHAAGEEFDDFDLIIDYTSTIVVLMNELFPEESEKWGRNVAIEQSLLDELRTKIGKNMTPAEYVFNPSGDTTVGISRGDVHRPKRYPQSYKRPKRKMPNTDNTGPQQEPNPYKDEQVQANGKIYGEFGLDAKIDGEKIRWASETCDWLQTKKVDVDGDDEKLEDMFTYIAQTFNYLHNLGLDVDNLSNNIKREVTNYRAKDANKQVFGYDVFYLDPNKFGDSKIYPQNMLRLIYHARAIVTELAKDPEYSVRLLKMFKDGPNVGDLSAKLFPDLANSISNNAKVKVGVS